MAYSTHERLEIVKAMDCQEMGSMELTETIKLAVCRRLASEIVGTHEGRGALRVRQTRLETSNAQTIGSILHLV